MFSLAKKNGFIGNSLCWIIAHVVLLALPSSVPAMKIVSDPFCKKYGKEVEEAVRSCDYDRLGEIEKVSIKARNECLALVVFFGRCQYFHSCVRTELDHAYKECNLDKVRKIEEFTNKTFTQCDDFVIMQDIVKNVKCIYFPVCKKAALKKKVSECDIEGVLETQKLVDSSLFNQCRDYDLMVKFLEQTKSDYFYDCQNDSLLKAINDCNLDGILKLESVVRDKLSGARNFQYIEKALTDSKCEYFSLCADKGLTGAAQSCDTETFIKLMDHLNSSRKSGCSQLDQTDLKQKLQKKVNTYIENCASQAISFAFENNDRLILAGIDRLLAGYPETPKKREIEALKRKLVKEEVEKRLAKGKADCDINSINKAEKLLADRTSASSSWCDDCRQLSLQVEEAKCSFFSHCVADELKKAKNNCDKKKIEEIKKFYYSQKIEGECVSLEKVFDDFECYYYYNCAESKLNEMVSECNREGILAWKKTVKNDVSRECPDYDHMLDSYEDVLADYFESCSKTQMYKALKTCNLDRLLEVEAKVYKDFHGHFGTPGQKRRQWVAKEIKCSYYDRCMKKYGEYLSHNCNMAEIENLEKTINKSMSNCANYYIQKKEINEIKRKCKPGKTDQ